MGDDDRESTLLREQLRVVAERGPDVPPAGMASDRDRADVVSPARWPRCGGDQVWQRGNEKRPRRGLTNRRPLRSRAR